MFLSVRIKEHQRQALNTVVIDKDTGRKVPRVIWANDETGRYRQDLSDENGKLIIDHKNKCVASKIFKGNIMLVQKETAN